MAPVLSSTGRTAWGALRRKSSAARASAAICKAPR